MFCVEPPGETRSKEYVFIRYSRPFASKAIAEAAPKASSHRRNNVQRGAVRHPKTILAVETMLRIVIKSGNAGVDETAAHFPVPANILRMPFASTFRMTQVFCSAKYNSPAWLKAMGPGVSSHAS